MTPRGAPVRACARGCMHGWHPIRFTKLYKSTKFGGLQVYGYEPGLTNFELCGKIRKAHPDAAWHLFRMAVADKAGKVPRQAPPFISSFFSLAFDISLLRLSPPAVANAATSVPDGGVSHVSPSSAIDPGCAARRFELIRAVPLALCRRAGFRPPSPWTRTRPARSAARGSRPRSRRSTRSSR